MTSETARYPRANGDDISLQSGSAGSCTLRMLGTDCADLSSCQPEQLPDISRAENSPEHLADAISEVPVNAVTGGMPSRATQGRGSVRVGNGQSEPGIKRKQQFERDVIPQLDTLYSVARQLTSNGADADDLLQDTLVKAYTRFHTFEPQRHVKAWLVQIMRNTWIDSYRRRQRRPIEYLTAEMDGWERHAYDRHAGQVTIDARLLDLAAGSEVRDVLHQLPEPLQRVVYYAYVEGFRYREIAQIEGIPIGTVMSRLYRGRQQLQKLFGDAGYATGVTQLECRDESAGPTELAS